MTQKKTVAEKATNEAKPNPFAESTNPADTPVNSHTSDKRRSVVGAIRSWAAAQIRKLRAKRAEDARKEARKAAGIKKAPAQKGVSPKNKLSQIPVTVLHPVIKPVKPKVERTLRPQETPRNGPPPCFESKQQWGDYRQCWKKEIAAAKKAADKAKAAGKKTRAPSGINYCEDCEPHYQEKMVGEKRCLHPGVTFKIDSDGFICGVRPPYRDVDKTTGKPIPIRVRVRPKSKAKTKATPKAAPAKPKAKPKAKTTGEKK
jgi:hypothetical protein